MNVTAALSLSCKCYSVSFSNSQIPDKQLQCCNTVQHARAQSAHLRRAWFRYIHTLSSQRPVSVSCRCRSEPEALDTQEMSRISDGPLGLRRFSLCKPTLNTHARGILPCSGSDLTWRPSVWVSAGIRAPAPVRCPTTRPQQQQHRPPPSCAPTPGIHTLFQRDRPHSAAARTDRALPPGAPPTGQRSCNKTSGPQNIWTHKSHLKWLNVTQLTGNALRTLVTFKEVNSESYEQMFFYTLNNARLFLPSFESNMD